MSVSINSQVVLIKKEGDASAKADLARVALKKQLGRKSRDNVRAILLPDFAFVYKVALVAGEAKAEGKQVLDSGADAYEACRKALSRTLDAVFGISAGSSPKPEFTRKQITEAKRFLSLFESKTLAKQALEQL